MKSSMRDAVLNERLFDPAHITSTFLDELGYKIQFMRNTNIKKIYVELTDRCNLNCSICYRKSWNHSTPNIDMDKKTFNKFCADIKVFDGVEEVVIGGLGEPTFHPDIIDVLERLKDYKLHIMTNGTLFSDELVNKMMETVKTLTISVDAMGDSLKKIRGISLSVIEAGIKKLQKVKRERRSVYPKVELQFVAAKSNIKHIFDVIDFAHNLKCGKLIVSHLLPQSSESKDDILYTLAPNQKMNDLWHKIRMHAFKRACILELPNVSLKTQRRCDFIEDLTAYVTAAGDVVPCYRLSHSSEEYVFGRKKQVFKQSYGNINDSSLVDIWNNKRYQELRYTIHGNFHPSCMDCKFVDGCSYAMDTLEDCYKMQPTCADCLWGREFIRCP